VVSEVGNFIEDTGPPPIPPPNGGMPPPPKGWVSKYGGYRHRDQGTGEGRVELRCTDDVVPAGLEGTQAAGLLRLSPLSVGDPGESALTLVKTHCPILLLMDSPLVQRPAESMAEARGRGHMVTAASVLRMGGADGSGGIFEQGMEKSCELQSAGAARFAQAAVRTLRDPLVSGLSQATRQSKELLKAIRSRMSQADGRLRQFMRDSDCVGASGEGEGAVVGLSREQLAVCRRRLGQHAMTPAQRAAAGLLLETGGLASGHPHAAWSFVREQMAREACHASAGPWYG